MPPFASSEHEFLGDVELTKLGDKDYQFTLPNGVKLKFGTIIALAGDYYGVPKQPICTGTDEQQLRSFFLDAFNTFYHGDKKEMEDLIDMIHKERQLANEAIKDKKSEVTALDGCAFKETVDSLKDTKGKYLELAKRNLDHFGADALLAYKTGHKIALEEAANGNLELAYIYEAFACHFLTDSFAAGHMRTPRRALYDVIGEDVGSYLSLLQHNEDGDEGLTVTNELGQTWTAYGDGHLFEDCSAENRIKINEAMKTAVAEVYAAFNSKKVPENIDALGIFKHMPQVVEEMSSSPLFIFQDGKIFSRKKVGDKQCHEHQELTKLNVGEFLIRYEAETVEDSPLFKQAQAGFKKLDAETKAIFRSHGNPTLFKRKKAVVATEPEQTHDSEHESGLESAPAQQQRPSQRCCGGCALI